MGIKFGVFFVLYLKNGTPNTDKPGVEQYESTFCTQNTILNVGMETRLKGKRPQTGAHEYVSVPSGYAYS